MPGPGKSNYQMLEPDKEQLELNEEENEITGNTADGASTYSSQNSSDD